MPFKITPQQMFLMRRLIWPDVQLYDKELEVLASMVTNRETYVPAANKMGKDFTVALGGLLAFLICLRYGVTCRIVNTSVAEHHLKVVWGEIGRFLRTAKCWPDGVPIQGKGENQIFVNHMEIRYGREAATKNPLSYLAGRVSAEGEGLAGHHADFTLAIADEASGIPSSTHEMFQGWASHIVYIGNCNPCQNQFKRGVKEGSKLDQSIKVIRIRAQDSPNVKAKSDDAFPGVLSYSDYLWRRTNWDKVRQSVGLDAQFYEGAELLLYPPDWLNRAEGFADKLGRDGKGKGTWGKWRITLGVDPAEGGDSSSFCVGDDKGIIHLLSMKTPDTNMIPNYILQLINRYSILAEDVCIDTGGGGKQHADRLRAMGYNVRTIGFGEKVSLDIKYGTQPASVRRDVRATSYEYENRRSQMGGELRELLDPARGEIGYGIPANLRGAIDDPDTDLRSQLAPIPLMTGSEGRLKLPPKHKRNPTTTANRETNEITLTELIGHSPDEFDALLLQTHALLHPSAKKIVGRLV